MKPLEIILALRNDLQTHVSEADAAGKTAYVDAQGLLAFVDALLGEAPMHDPDAIAQKRRAMVAASHGAWSLCPVGVGWTTPRASLSLRIASLPNEPPAPSFPGDEK